MELRHLAALVAVVDHGTFSAAADALMTVQSNVSSHVARLEAELGVDLIDRASGKPTVEGTAVVARARRIEREVEALRSDLAALSTAEVTGTVRLGIIGTTGRWLAPLLLDTMARRHPGVRVVMVDATTTSLIPQVVRGELDLALVNLPVSDGGIVTEELFTEDRVVIAPEDHPLADHAEVDLATLADHEVLLEPVGTGFRDELEAAARQAGITLTTRAEVDGMRLLTSLAFGGYGAAVLPVTAIRIGETGPWRQVALRGVPTRAVGLARRRHDLAPPPARALGDCLRGLVTDLAPDLPGLHLPDQSASAGAG